MYNEVPIYEIKDKFLFFKVYRKKMEYLEKINDQNLIFQKRILDKKRTEARDYFLTSDNPNVNDEAKCRKDENMYKSIWI